MAEKTKARSSPPRGSSSRGRRSTSRAWRRSRSWGARSRRTKSTSKLQTLIDLRSDVDAAKATATAKIATETAQAPALLALMGALGSYVKATFGSSPDVLADFGLAPKARAQVTVETKAVAAAKRKATRAARHTMGPKQKKAITGVVPDPLVIPTHAPSPTVTTATPASPTAPATSGGSQATGAAATSRTA